MATFSVLDIMRTPQKTDMEASFDSMMIPHWTNYLTPIDVENLRRIATSKKYAGNMNLKYRMIDNIMKSRGFARFAGGTNRVVYKYYEDPRFLAKIAVDNVGMKDNPAEYVNQNFLKPYCAKMFYVTPCGTVGFAERLLPITSVQEFKLIADCVFDLLYYKIIGKYIIEDVGTKYFMNWGLRKNFGPALLDYPYLFELDGAKIQCKNMLPDGTICMGEIDYDDGFNELICKKCGRQYNASELRKDPDHNSFIINKGGKVPMNVKIVKNGEVVVQSNSVDTIQKPVINRKVVAGNGNATIVRGNKVIAKMEKGVVTDGIEEVKEVVTETTFDIDPDPIYESKDEPIDDHVTLAYPIEKESQLPEVEDEPIDDHVTLAYPIEKESQLPEVEEEDIPQTSYEEEEFESDSVDEKSQLPEVEEGVPLRVDQHNINIPSKSTVDSRGRRVIGGASIRTDSGFINPEDY